MLLSFSLFDCWECIYIVLEKGYNGGGKLHLLRIVYSMKYCLTEVETEVKTWIKDKVESHFEQDHSSFYQVLTDLEILLVSC